MDTSDPIRELEKYRLEMNALRRVFDHLAEKYQELRSDVSFELEVLRDREDSHKIANPKLSSIAKEQADRLQKILDKHKEN